MPIDTYPDSAYESYHVERGTFQDSGMRFLVPAGEPPVQVELISLHAGYEIHWIVFSATREGEPPVVPHPRMFDNDRNMIFLNGWTAGSTPVPKTGKAYVYGIYGCYYYVRHAPAGLARGLPTGVLPWKTAGGSNTQNITDNYFSPAVMGYGHPAPLTSLSGIVPKSLNDLENTGGDRPPA